MNILEAVTYAANELAPKLGLEIYSIEFHPSDDLMIFTSEGKKYLMKSDVVAALGGDNDDVEALALVVYAALGGAVKVETPDAPTTFYGNATVEDLKAALPDLVEEIAETFVAPAADVPFAPISDDTSHDSPKAKAKGKKK